MKKAVYRDKKISSNVGIKRAFTLAEVLITLSIIGIIAVITLPALMTNLQVSELQTRFKKSYNDLDAFAATFKAQEGMTVPLYTSLYGPVNIKNKFVDYIAKAGTVSDWTESSRVNAGIESPNKWHLLTNPNAEYNWWCDASGLVEDGIGRIYAFDDAPPRGFNGPRVCVDINGKKGPNTFGIDVFSFLFTTDGSIINSGEGHIHNNSYDESDDEKHIGYSWASGTTTGASKCYSDHFGTTCAYYAFNDINPKNSNETYWKDFIGKKQYLKK